MRTEQLGVAEIVSGLRAKVESCKIRFKPFTNRFAVSRFKAVFLLQFPFVYFILVLLIHYRLNRLSQTIYWKSPISILGTSGYEIYIFLEKTAKLFANSGDPDQTPRSAVSDLGLHCLPFTLLLVSRLQ